MSAAGNDARAQAVDADAGGVRRRQLLVFSGLAAALLVALALWLGMGSGKTPPAVTGIDAELAGPDTAEEAWTRRSEARIGTIEARLREMETDARRLGTENERLRAKLAADAADARAVIDRQAAMIEDLERRMSEGMPELADPGQAAAFPGAPVDPEYGPDDGLPLIDPPAPLIETFELEDPSAGASAIEAWKPLSVWLPAGSHAEAVVLAGVDASAGISSQGDPRPVLLRLIGPAWTAAEDGSALSVDVAGCTVTGAAHGDLSSEKVYARLRTLTCAGPEPGSVIETEVAGFIAGSGKTGVRGPVVSREGALVQKAFLAGLVSGAGQGAAQAFQPQAVATGTSTAAVANTGLGDIGRAGLGAGASSAGQKVADYLIRRAEQYQPVIQLRSGTRVSVVFLEGARLDGGLLADRGNQGENP